MTSDIYVGLAFMFAASVGLFTLGAAISRAVPKWVSDVLIIAMGLGIAAYIRYLWDNILLTRLVPFSNVIVMGNWFPLMGGLIAGLMWSRFSRKSLRRATPAALFVAGLFALAQPLMGVPPECRNKWRRRDPPVCLQTSPNTCSAACSATILKHYDIEVSEGEMAELCFTRQGTTWMGLIHGLSIKGREAGFRPRMFECGVKALEEMPAGPKLLSVELTNAAMETLPHLLTQGWKPGVKHSVVLLAIHGDLFLVGDPAVGYEVWDRRQLELLWSGLGIWLVEA